MTTPDTPPTSPTLGAGWESQTASHMGSHTVVPDGTPTYGTYGTDGESGCERGNLTGVDAHASRTPIHQGQPAPRTLAYRTPCRYCAAPIFVALCSDGRWRTFDTEDVPAAPACVWAWRKHHGMQEQDLVPGKRLHFCAAYHSPNLAPWDR